MFENFRLPKNCERLLLFCIYVYKCLKILGYIFGFWVRFLGFGLHFWVFGLQFWVLGYVFGSWVTLGYIMLG